MNTPHLDTMTRRRTTRSNARPGFSLIELTAVLVIMGLLMAGAAISIPSLMKRSKVRITKASMTTIKTAINTYMADNAGEAPASISSLVPSYLDTGADIDSWSRPYYFIATPGTLHPFSLISSGPDKEFQTSDDIDLWTMDVKTGN
jgi:prepilin-type N-terminal cleavage/methylation domain-containing protein